MMLFPLSDYNYKLYFGLFYILKSDIEKPSNFSIQFGMKHSDLIIQTNEKKYLIKTLHYDKISCLSYQSLFSMKIKKTSLNISHLLWSIIQMKRRNEFPYKKLVIYSNLVCLCLHQTLIMTCLEELSPSQVTTAITSSENGERGFSNMDSFIKLPNVIYYSFTDKIIPFIMPVIGSCTPEELQGALDSLVIGLNCYNKKQFMEFIPNYISASQVLPSEVSSKYVMQYLFALLNRICSGNKLDHMHYGFFTKRNVKLSSAEIYTLFSLITYNENIQFPDEPFICMQYNDNFCPNYYFTFPEPTTTDIIDSYYGRINDIININSLLTNYKHVLVYGSQKIGKTTVVQKYTMMQTMPVINITKMNNDTILHILNTLLERFNLIEDLSMSTASTTDKNITTIIENKIIVLADLLSKVPIPYLIILDNFPMITEIQSVGADVFGHLKMLVDFLISQPTLYFIAIVENPDLIGIDVSWNRYKILGMNQNDILHLIVRHVNVKPEDLLMLNEFLIICATSPQMACNLIKQWKEMQTRNMDLKHLFAVASAHR